ncbi:MAG: hypothetical protein GY928_04850 [Colwellia sp.]|nr:hypothetical protein [Colwellia sp.]
MKCRHCGVEYSARVLKIHETRCNVKVAESFNDLPDSKEHESETILVSKTEYTLEQLLEMAIADKNIEHAPSTIKRWKEPRLRKELGL